YVVASFSFLPRGFIFAASVPIVGIIFAARTNNLLFALVSKSVAQIDLTIAELLWIDQHRQLSHGSNSAPGRKMTDPKRIRALVVDDEPLARGMIREMLASDPDVEIVGECSNGREAIEAIDSLNPDLLFLDIQMPEFGGFEVLESIESDRAPYIIFVTAFDQFAVRAFEVHALDYLLKPFDRERFDAAWQRAKAVIGQERSEERDQRILALLEELKTEQKYIERLVVKV